MRSRILGLISRLYRRPHELEALRGSRIRWLRSALFVGAALLVAGPFAVALSSHVSEWLSFHATVEIPWKAWRTAYIDSPEPCGPDARERERCLANPSNPQLWESSTTREDQAAHFGRIIHRPGSEYWLGTTLSAEQARAAYEARANMLVLGQLRNIFKIWVNGRELMSGSWRDNEPIAVQIPLPWLRGSEPVRIAILCIPQPGVGLVGIDVPDSLEHPPNLGLTTKPGATAWRRYQYFWSTARPLVFMTLDFVLACLFFAVWRVAPEKSEYFYIALLAMTFSLYQMRFIELVYVILPRKVSTSLGLILAILYAFMGMLTGFAFARMRSAILLWLGVLCGALCLAVPFLGIASQIMISRVWLGSLADLGLVLGALSCFLQAYYLYMSRREGVFGNLRLRRLLLFGTGLLMLAVMNQVDTFVLAPHFIQIVFGRSGPFLLLLSLGLVALSEYRAEHSLALEMPVSKFHRLDPLPDRVHGALLNVDLKGSEHLSRLSARLGAAGDLVETCLSHLWSAVSQSGGLVIQTEGDALRALFPSEDVGDAVQVAFEATDAMRRNLVELERRFASQGLSSSLPEGGIHFRAAIVEGDIRPVWQAYGGSRLAGWMETGGANLFIEGSRLLELERKFEGRGVPASLVVAPPELRERLGTKLRGRWICDRRALEGKHGRVYEVAAYVPAEPLEKETVFLEKPIPTQA